MTRNFSLTSRATKTGKSSEEEQLSRENRSCACDSLQESNGGMFMAPRPLGAERLEKAEPEKGREREGQIHGAFKLLQGQAIIDPKEICRY